jgi:sugar-specific transcriptional regulator TrmB
MNIAERERVIRVLEQLGCSATEAVIYLHSLQSGPSSVQDIARSVRLNRVTVHSAVEQLLHKGFLFESRKGKRRLIAAETPDILSRILRKKEQELQLLQPGVDIAQVLLSSVRRADQSVPTVKFYEGVDGLKRMLEETLVAKGEVLVFTYVDLFSQLLQPAYLEKYYKRRAAKGISTRLIFPLEAFGKRVSTYASKYKMQVRFLPAGVQWKSGIFSWNDTIAIQSFTEGKVTCTIIENEDIAHFYRTIIYPLCWEQARPLASAA